MLRPLEQYRSTSLPVSPPYGNSSSSCSSAGCQHDRCFLHILGKRTVAGKQQDLQAKRDFLCFQTHQGCECELNGGVGAGGRADVAVDVVLTLKL